MRVGFTGTQRGMTVFQAVQFANALERLEATEFIFGDSQGSDVEAAEIALENGIKYFTIYPQNKDTRKRAWFLNLGKDISVEGKGWHEQSGRWIRQGVEILYNDVHIRWMLAEPPLSRNMRIVDDCDYMLATPKEFEHTLRSGTWATIRYAWKKKKDKIEIIPPLEGS